MRPGELLILGLLLGLFLGIWGCRRWSAKRLQLKFARARRAEREALNFLKAQGYHILDMQCRVPVVTIVDGFHYQGAVRADIIARKGKKKYVVEVKAGREGEKPAQARTRRQLLEYFLVYRPDGVLLLDMETRRLQEICLQVGQGRLAGGRRCCLVVAGYILAFLAGTFFAWLGKSGVR
ncbi:MAG: hypothetical protein PWP65_484 [Clostridia bacterium]|nr:hypothetical protein [Clostridia bacterium]